MAKILLVEDNQYNREMLAKRLTRADFDVVTAVDGREGVDLARKEAPDVIVMVIIYLPDNCARLKKAKGLRNSPQESRLIGGDPLTRASTLSVNGVL